MEEDMKKKVLIVDDSAMWIKHGNALLEQAGYEVREFDVTDSEQYIVHDLFESVADVLIAHKIDVLLIDKDFGKIGTSTPLICKVRGNFPELPIVRWTGGWNNNPYMRYLGVTSIEKPTKKNKTEFVETFNKAVDEQKLILSGPMGILAALDETTKPDEYKAKNKAIRLKQIAQIAKLADSDRVSSDNYRQSWMITGEHSGGTKHELGHCICDGDLTAEDIRPHLPALQKVIAKFEAANEIDERFKYCAEFIKAGNLDELELVRSCY